MTLSDLFLDEDYQFKMRFHRGDIAEFFRPTAQHDLLILQRSHWLNTAPNTYADLLPEGIPLLEEACDLAVGLGTIPSGLSSIGSPREPRDQCLVLGQAWEPDFLLLKADAQSVIRLYGGCVCFPSSWSLSEKIGRPLDFIHGVVPDLNHQLGRQIEGFLSKIHPGISWERANWSLSRSHELNQHPERRLPRLDASVTLDQVWLRVEHQSLVALPQSQGILFGIRLENLPLTELKKDASMTERLCRALGTMSEDMARYKNLAAARSTILQLLGS